MACRPGRPRPRDAAANPAPGETAAADFLLLLGGLLDPGGNDRDADLALEIGVEGRTPDDVGIGIDEIADVVGRLVNLEQLHVVAADDRDDDALGALHRHAVEQRVRDRPLRRLERTVRALGLAGAHHRLAHLAHDRTDVGKVEVDQARHDHEIGDRANALLQHLVGQLERFLEGRFRLGDEEQVLVRNDDQGIDVLLQLLDPGLGRAHAPRAFEQERLGDHADGEHALFPRGLGDDRGSAGAGAAAHARGDEAHVHAIQRALDLGNGLFRSGAANLGTRPGAETLGDVGPELDAVFGDGVVERLGIGVGNDEIDALDLGMDHVGDGIATRAADADHGDAGTQFFHCRRSDIDAHRGLQPGLLQRAHRLFKINLPDAPSASADQGHPQLCPQSETQNFAT